MKVSLVCVMVLIYTYIAPYLGISFYRYRSNPGFCIGMVFALFNEDIKRKFVRWQAILALCLVLTIIKSIPVRLLPFLYPTAFFLLMYILSGVKENVLVKFLSSISLEMFIIQFIPIYIMMNDLHIKSTLEMVLLVCGLDIILAYIMHMVVLEISARLK